MDGEDMEEGMGDTVTAGDAATVDTLGLTVEDGGKGPMHLINSVQSFKNCHQNTDNWSLDNIANKERL